MSTCQQVYAPWCGHCKTLEPIYKKLAKRFAKVDTVTIAKMDGTENEHPDVEIKGFPTIVFFPAGEDSKPVSFDGGDRSLKVGAGLCQFWFQFFRGGLRCFWRGLGFSAVRTSLRTRSDRTA